MSSLYIHIPFCLSTCSYCSFNSFAGMESIFERYVQALKKEAVALTFSKDIEPLTTLFLGGGTPSVLHVDQLARILEFCREYFGFAPLIEISLEANPKTVDFIKLLSLKELGLNRLSIGIQSFVDEELQRLGRLHGAQDGWDAVKDAKSAGFSNISIDLMSGLPGQSPGAWQWSLETALSLEPQHLSLYQLTIEEGTRFEKMVADGQLSLPSEDEILAMDEITEKFCPAAGLKQYEISNYALSGYECRHNINYWENGDYHSLGAGAVGYTGGERVKTIGDPREYIRRLNVQEDTAEEREKLDTEASFRETVVMGLRMNQGVCLEGLYSRFGFELQNYYGDILSKLLREGLVMLINKHLCLTRKGRGLANQVMAELV